MDARQRQRPRLTEWATSLSLRWMCWNIRVNDRFRGRPRRRYEVDMRRKDGRAAIFTVDPRSPESVRALVDDVRAFGGKYAASVRRIR